MTPTTTNRADTATMSVLRSSYSAAVDDRDAADIPPPAPNPATANGMAAHIPQKSSFIFSVDLVAHARLKGVERRGLITSPYLTSYDIVSLKLTIA